MRSSRRARRRRLAWALGALAAALAVGLGVGYRMLTYQPPPPPPPPDDPIARRAQMARRVQIARRVERDIQAMRAPRPRGDQTRRRLVVRSDEVNAFLAGQPSAGGHLPAGIESVRDVRVRFEKGRVVATGYLTSGRRTVYVTVGGRLLPDGAGGVSFSPEQTLIGKMPMPSSMRRQVVQRIEEEIRRRLLESGVSVKAIQTTDGAIAIEGAPRGTR